MTMGKRINEKMLSHGLTQVELAKKTDASDSTISLWINGDVPRALILIYRLSRLFGCTVDDLICGCEEFTE